MVLGFQWDLARQTERLDWLVAQLPRYAAWGYRELYLHLEDAVEYPSLPGIARRGAYSHRQLGKLVDAATKAGIGVVPIVNLLGHTQYLIKVPSLRDLNELRDEKGRALPRGQICPVHPRTGEVAARLLRDVAPFCTAGKVHVGLDESFMLGRHPLSRRDIAEHGLDGHFARYVQRLSYLTRDLALRLGMWADMLYFLPGAIRHLPAGIVAYDWYYYPFRRLPRVEMYNFAERDLAEPLQARGIEYWGCPMNGAFRHEPLPVFRERLANIRSWWNRCRRVRAAGMLVSSWEPSHLSAELATAVDAAAASLWLGPKANDHEAMLAHGFKRAFPRLPSLYAALGAVAALKADRNAWCGYAHWERNDRWDVGVALGSSHTEPHSTPTASGRFPAALDASLRFRAYLLRRDVFAQRLSSDVAQLRQLLQRRRHRAGKQGRSSASARSGDPTVVPIVRKLLEVRRSVDRFDHEVAAARTAARAMQSRTRTRLPAGPNEKMIGRDAERLRKIRRWIRRALDGDLGSIRTASPVLGRCQLQFVVWNFAPAVQEVVLEQRGRDGTWKPIHRRFTVEFRAAAARRRTDIRRQFSAPVSSSGVKLRIAIRGVGQVKIGCPTLTDGATQMNPIGWRPTQWKLLGKPAPQRGLPRFDREKNQGTITLRFAK